MQCNYLLFQNFTDGFFLNGNIQYLKKMFLVNLKNKFNLNKMKNRLKFLNNALNHLEKKIIYVKVNQRQRI